MGFELLRGTSFDSERPQSFSGTTSGCMSLGLGHEQQLDLALADRAIQILAGRHSQVAMFRVRHPLPGMEIE